MFIDGSITFYFNLVIACLLGLSLFKCSDRLGIEVDLQHRLSSLSHSSVRDDRQECLSYSFRPACHRSLWCYFSSACCWLRW